MSTFDYVRVLVFAQLRQFLPEKMMTPEALGLMLAIGLQESKFIYRKQVGGPARGFWQFEQGGGVKAVMVTPSSRKFILPVLSALGYEDSVPVVYEAIAHNDILAAVVARLFLYTNPKPLPGQDEEAGWQYYLNTWRPDKPHPETWPALYARAFENV